MFEKKVFISHSSKNKEIADHLCAFIARLGVKEKNIFCSSVIGQGIGNGEKLNTAIANAIQDSSLLIFLLSYDFLNSSYCMEELGVGWYLSQSKKASCFYLVLPDMNLSDLVGFVNSKIDRFALLSTERSDEICIFSADLCKKLGIRPKAHTVVTNAENVFISSIRLLISDLVKERQSQINAEKSSLETIVELQSMLAVQKKECEKAGLLLRFTESSIDRKILNHELDTIVRFFAILGRNSGLKSEEYFALGTEFWRGITNRYLELLDVLQRRSTSSLMEKFFATLYLCEGNYVDAYSHLYEFVKLENRYTDLPSIEYFSSVYPYTMKEIIILLEDYLAVQQEGICKASLKEVISFLQEREQRISQ